MTIDEPGIASAIKKIISKTLDAPFQYISSLLAELSEQWTGVYQPFLLSSDGRVDPVFISRHMAEQNRPYMNMKIHSNNCDL